LRCPDLGHCGAPDSSDGHVVLHCQDLSWCLRSSSLLFSLPSLRQRGSTVDKRWRAGRCRVAGDGAVPPSPRPPPCPLHLGSAMALNFGRWAPAAARLPTPAATSPTPSTRARKAKHSPASWSSARRQGAQRGKFSFFSCGAGGYGGQVKSTQVQKNSFLTETLSKLRIYMGLPLYTGEKGFSNYLIFIV
jgi:hypothetical protein